jgi:Domain of unknown function (DUF4190)
VSGEPQGTGSDPRREPDGGAAPSEDGRPPRPLDQAGAVPDEQIRRGGRTARWTGVASLVLSLFFPLLGFVTAIVAIVLGRRARRRARQRGMPVPGAVAGITMGTIGLLIMPVLVAVVLSVLWTEMSGYQRCVAGANTHTDRQICLDTWNPRVENKLRQVEQRLNLPDGSLSDHGDLRQVVGS